MSNKMLGIYEDNRFISARKHLIILSILFLTINVSAARLLEANTFIFKVSFENSAGLNVILFFGVIVLTVRYFSAAYIYHDKLFGLWTNDMLSDRAMILSYREVDGTTFASGEYKKVIQGFLVKHQELNELLTLNLEQSSRDLTFSYFSKGLSKRHIYCASWGDSEINKPIKLEVQSGKWTRKDYLWFLIIESKYQMLSFFKRHESLEILLPYLLSVVSLLSFLFTARGSLLIGQ